MADCPHPTRQLTRDMTVIVERYGPEAVGCWVRQHLGDAAYSSVGTIKPAPARGSSSNIVMTTHQTGVLFSQLDDDLINQQETAPKPRSRGLFG